jgi:thymidylate synthase
MLQKDSDTRQAVVALYRPNDCGISTKDMPCTLTLQFMIRNDKLNLIVNMRSNDLWFGGVYDIFCFTALQELMANELKVEVGLYYHHVGSFHLYEKNIKDVQDAITEYETALPRTPPRITPYQSMEELCIMEKEIRTGEAITALEDLIKQVDSWPSTPSLWGIGMAAWRWKRVMNSTEIKEEQRRFARGLLQDRLGRMFERCFH